MSTPAMRVTFEVTAIRMATAMAVVALLDDDMPDWSRFHDPEPPAYTGFVERMSQAEAREALRTCYWRYGEGDCWPDDWPTNARNRAFDIVVERGWAS